MKKRDGFVFFLLVLFFAGHPVQAAVSADSLSADSSRIVSKGVMVMLYQIPVFIIHTRIGPLTPTERADLIKKKIELLADDPLFQPDSLIIAESENSVDIVYGDQIITSVTLRDENAEKSDRFLIAKERQTKIVFAINRYRESISTTRLISGFGFALLVIVGMVILFRLINRVFRYLFELISRQKEWFLKKLSFRQYKFLDERRLLTIFQFLVRTVRLLIHFAVFLAGLTTIFYLLPWTKRFTVRVLELVIGPLKGILTGFVHYIPNLLTIIIIIFIARLVIRLFRYLKKEIERGTLSLPGFHIDFALPTFNILRILVIAITLILVWPFLPGSDSHIFQGVSVFLGLIFSLTSASTLSNVMAGFSLTYTRAFRLGDRVKIGEINGFIIEKTMLVTKIRTLKNEEVTIPNSKIMGSEVINYSIPADDKGLIIYTTVTIGYDAPWKQVHALLIAAAEATDDILKEPKPFVLQTGLNDFYVAYQINAYTRSPEKLQEIYSILHSNIQDKFNEAGMEIMSPHYRAVRDGNTITIPEQQRAEDYTPLSFRIEQKQG